VSSFLGTAWKDSEWMSEKLCVFLKCVVILWDTVCSALCHQTIMPSSAVYRGRFIVGIAHASNSRFYISDSVSLFASTYSVGSPRTCPLLHTYLLLPPLSTRVLITCHPRLHPLSRNLHWRKLTETSAWRNSTSRRKAAHHLHYLLSTQRYSFTSS